ncbi:MAG: twin-arginine translocation signal domain-containing protein, partial [Burkholderiales bacterium]
MNKNKYLGNSSRREFLVRTAAAGAAMSSHTVLAQVAVKPPAEPAGTVSNNAIMAEKFSGMPMHSERPLTGSVSAEF